MGWRHTCNPCPLPQQCKWMQEWTNAAMGRGKRSEKLKYCVRVCLTAALILTLQCPKHLVAEPADSLTWEVSLADLVLEHSTGRQSLPLRPPVPFQRSGSSTQSQSPLRMTMTLIEAC